MTRSRPAIERAAKALQAADLAPSWNGVLQLLTDLRHYCRVNNLDMDELEMVAYNHAMADLALDNEDERKAELKWQTQ